MRGEPSTVEVNVVVTEFLQIANALMATAGRRVYLTRPRVSAGSTARTAREVRWRSTRPFHEAVDRRARRARHRREVFGLAGTPSGWGVPTRAPFPGRGPR